MPLALESLRFQLSEVIDGTKPGTPGLPTGIATLDAALPNNGLPRGRLTELVGAPGSGKTTLVRQLVERAVRDGWWVAYIDAARTLAPRDWAHVSRKHGPDEGLWVVRPDSPARGAWCADVLLRSSAFALVVLDGAPLLTRNVAVRLTRLAREADAAFLALSDDTKASELAGSLRLRVARVATSRRLVSIRGAPEPQAVPRTLTVVIEKGGPYQTVTVGDVNRGIEVARRVRAHPEVPDRRGVARQQKQPISTRINARSRRCAEPDIPNEPFIVAPGNPAGLPARASTGTPPAALGHTAARPR